MKLYLPFVLMVTFVTFLAPGLIQAQTPIGFNWSEQVNLARDSGNVLLDSNSSAKVIWDKDKSGIANWDPANPLPAGDEVVLDLSDAQMSVPFGSGPFAGQLLGSWTADDTDGWTQDGEALYLLAYVPAAYSSSGLDEYGVSTLMTISGWPNNAPVAHNVVGGGPIKTVAVIYVDTANDSGPWVGSPDAPYQTIQAGLDAAASGDVVVVANGVYAGAGNVNLDFGGKDIVLRSKSGPQVTIIDGDASTGGLVFDSGETAAAVLDGFTIRNCNAGGSDGGAVFISASSPTIQNCVLEANSATNGGAIACEAGSSAAIINCLFIDNSADSGGAIYCDASSPTISSCTLTGNSATTMGGGVATVASTVTVYDSILWDNTAPSGHEIALTSTASPSSVVGRYSDIDGGSSEAYVESGCTLDLDGSDIDADPQFASGLLHGYYLSQIAAGQGLDSPCVDTGSDTAANLGLDERTTRTDGIDDAGTVDMGYHAEQPLWITDVYYDHSTQTVVVAFTSEAGVDYVLEVTEADAYSDSLTWSDRPLVSATGAVTTVSDDLVANPLSSDFRFYRVKRADATETSWQTAGLFELDLEIDWTMWRFFISTPLVPDADHASVQAVLGTQTGNRVGPVITRHVHARGINERMSYDESTQTWSVLAPTTEPFDIEPCVGYYLSCGGGLAETLPLRLTGYVPGAAQSAFVGKAGWAVSKHWIAYSMPRPTTLEDLGLVDAVTPWASANRVRLRPLGSGVWTAYCWVDDHWENLLEPGVAVNPPLACGQALELTRQGLLDTEDYLVMPTWYENPPNDW
jgi:predicted outer membrane repeat protein